MILDEYGEFSLEFFGGAKRREWIGMGEWDDYY